MTFSFDTNDEYALYQIDKAGLVKTERSKLQQIPANLQKLSLISCEGLASQHDWINSIIKPIERGMLELANFSGQIRWRLWVSPEHVQSVKDTLINQTQFDFLAWPVGVDKPPRLLLFDMDSTFIEIEVIDALAARNGAGEQVAEVTELAMQGKLDFSESLIERVKCLKGLSDDAIKAIEDSLPISKGIESLVATAQNNQCKVAIVSGGFLPFVEKLKTKLSLDAVHANELEVVNGDLTGRVLGDIVDASAKAEFLIKLCDEFALSLSETMAIGDGANDLKMMEIAGFNCAYRAKPAVKQAANGRLDRSDFSALSLLLEWVD